MRDLEIRGAGNLLGAGAVRPHRRGRLRPLLPDGHRGGRRAEGRAGRASRPRSSSTCPSTPTCPRDYVGTRGRCAWRPTAGSPRSPTPAEVDDIRAEWEDRYGPPPAAGRRAARRRPAAGRVRAARRHAASPCSATPRASSASSLQGVAEGAAAAAGAEGGGQGRRSWSCRSPRAPAEVAAALVDLLRDLVPPPAETASEGPAGAAPALASATP